MTFDNQFGLWERLLHRFAFRTGFSQLMLADLEDRIFAGDLAGVSADHPVFISGLPRSGTTILLQMLADTGHFATHTYQEMPFLLCPLLWNRFARRFIADRAPRERAHGDGLQISSRSPEAFEEMVWKQFWRDHYTSDRIQPWTSADQNAEFDAFFQRHMAKIIAVRERDRPDSRGLRYLSKNNVNIARIGAPPEPLRRGIFIVPYREPLQHAASMLLQHRRFSTMHHKDRFARQYMEGIGHHDFGLSLRPINFSGWLAHAGDPDDIEFWLRYWTAAYRYVLEQISPTIHLVSYTELTTEPQGTLRRLAEAAQISPDDLELLVDTLRPPRQHETAGERISREVLDEALMIHGELRHARRL